MLGCKRRGYDTLLDGDGALPGLRERLREDEARKAALVAELEALAGLTSAADLDTARLKRDARARVADVRALLGRHVPQARQMLRKLLAEPIRVAPIREDGRKGLRFEGRLVFDRLLAGAGLGLPGVGTLHSGHLRECPDPDATDATRGRGGAGRGQERRARVRAALRAALERVRGPLVRTAFIAALDRARGPRRRAACRA